MKSRVIYISHEYVIKVTTFCQHMSFVELMHKRMNYLLHRNFTKRKNKSKECSKKGKEKIKIKLVCEQCTNAGKLHAS